jgi:hypothetical protein
MLRYATKNCFGVSMVSRDAKTQGLSLRNRGTSFVNTTSLDQMGNEGFYEDLAHQNTIAHLFQLQLEFRRCRIWVSVRSHMGFGHRRSVLKAVPTEAPTIPLANKNRPVSQPFDLLAIRPAHCSAYVRLHCLVNGLPHWATGHLVRQQAGQWVNAQDLRMPPCNSFGNIHRGLQRPVRVP